MTFGSSRPRVLCYIGSLAAGGAERQVLEVLKHLDRKRFAPELALAIRGGELLREVPADVPLHAFPSPAAAMPWTQRGGLGRLARWRWLSRLLREREIAVVYDRTYLATLDAAPACWRRGVPRISAAVAEPRIQFELYARHPRWLWRAGSRWAYRSANLVLANSAGLRRQLIDFWSLPEAQVREQPNGVDWARVDALLQEAPPRQPDGLFRLLTVGRIDADKGHADLLAAVAELVQQRGWRDLRWQILGTGPQQETLQHEVQQRGLGEQVEFWGVVGNPFPFYRDADLFCLPSRSEGLPNVILEALGCGTPVVATDCPSGPRELLADGAFGRLTPVRAPRALAEAIAACRAQPAIGREQAARGRAVIRDRYDIRTVVRTLEDILETAAHRRRLVDETAPGMND